MFLKWRAAFSLSSDWLTWSFGVKTVVSHSKPLVQPTTRLSVFSAPIHFHFFSYFATDRLEIMPIAHTPLIFSGAQSVRLCVYAGPLSFCLGLIWKKYFKFEFFTWIVGFLLLFSKSDICRTWVYNVTNILAFGFKNFIEHSECPLTGHSPSKHL